MKITKRLGLLLAALVIAATGVLAAASPGHASAPPAGYAGVVTYSAPVCGTGYVPVNLADRQGQTHGNYFYVHNEPDGHSCVVVHDGKNDILRWYVSTREYNGMPTRWWEYPFIQNGIYYGSYTCSHRSSQGSSSTCMRYPVQVQHDGFPLTSVYVWPHMASGNSAYDIWFNKEDIPQDQIANFKEVDGAEVMVWVNHPGVCLCNYHILWTTRILGWKYYVIGWTHYDSAQHKSWLYTSYIRAVQGRYLPPTWLNYFFRDAEAHGRLMKTWYLTAIDFGFEMNIKLMRICPDGVCRLAPSGTGADVKNYTLTGVK